ncbi:putative guanine nucleotide exchange factor for Ras-like small GTPases [Lyophyllum shimeji]|uniref:Guanine nucleotide exchange factor for Ras-like small GTPases n=1 Tax=Lyophyllum shimeji TaxID=47721 RepID=A0A9P3PMA3_LYOSH|nr:putative guanine nucleotide exchange factor for Ras-like small GTPases [Lyophyllum shimeji]
MAAVATPMYSAHHQSFLPQVNRATTSTISQPQAAQQQDQGLLDEEQFTTLFCRALYDYEAQDPSALSFRRGDIIEVLTQQPSGWWDGLLGDERGWFPSNYVEIISDEEAELAFSASESSGPESSATELQHDSSMVDMSHAMMRGMSQAANEEWLENEMATTNGIPMAANTSAETSSQSSDFWMPQVTPDGQIYYVNTQTGQHSRDLPQEADDEISDSELAGLASQSSSRSGTSAGLAFGLNGSLSASSSMQDIAGFGIPRRTGTPEPWVRKLADDGRSYYYYNKIDGRVQWSRPEAPAEVQKAPSQSSSSSPSRSRQANSSKRLSVYSDDSDVQPVELSTRKPITNGHASKESQARPSGKAQPPLDYTTAERIARSLQQAVAPPPPELVTELSALTRAAIQAVVNNIQLNGLARRPEEDRDMDGLINNVVLSVRNLLYVLAVPTTQIPKDVLPREVRDLPAPNVQLALKPAQRRVTATLSRLVLSARAMQYDSGSLIADTLSRIEIDAEELERAVLSFALEVQRMEHTSALPQPKPPKRLHGVFGTANIGPGLVGAGSAGRWKGFGWVPLDDAQASSMRVFGPEVITDLKSYLANLDVQFRYLLRALQTSDQSSVEQVRLRGRDLVSQVSSMLAFVSNIHVARHVDIDGFQQDGGPSNGPYAQTVEDARLLVRTLETVVQAAHNDAAVFLLTIQSVRDSENPRYRQERNYAYDHLDALSSSLSANLTVLLHTLDSLLSLGHEQAEMAQGDYNGSIEWRMSRLSMRPISSFMINGEDDTDMIDMEAAFRGSSAKLSKDGQVHPSYQRSHANSDASYSAASSTRMTGTTETETLIADEDDLSRTPDVEASSPLFDDELRNTTSPPRPTGSRKLEKILGDEYANKVAADLKPWYLRPNYNPQEILIDPDNTVKGGTLPALVERLTAHDQADPTFNQAFLMTFKSFMTVNELFDLLVARFRIEPPPDLKPNEREEWGKLKQHIIQMRVLNTFKSMVQDEDVLDKEDLHILDRMKAFVSSDELAHVGAAKQLLIHIERAQRGGDTMVKMMPQGMPPAPIYPRTNKKLKLQDIEPLELARQLTIMESNLYQKIKPMECLQRAREGKTENMDNIAMVIQTSNRIADWVAECVLSKEDSRKRANVVKHLISVADRCRTLNNFSTMIAITSGLNTPPIHRLRRTWEQVNQRSMAQFGACEMTIDSNKNFRQYRQLMATVTPPCVPFIGVFLSTLQFIQDGNPDMLPGGLVNFRKRQKASEVINDIKRWQAQPFNFTHIPSIQQYIEESLNQFNDPKASADHFYALSLEREPREREDEKMARLLQESGFL